MRPRQPKPTSTIATGEHAETAQADTAGTVRKNRMPEAQRRLYRLTYESQASLPEYPDARLAALHDILKSARCRNIRCGVSGVLLYNRKGFFQTLEGNRAEVEQVFERIARDTRHTQARVLERKFVSSRIFHSWSMAYVEFPADASWSEQIVEELPAMLTGRTSKQADTRLH